VIARNPMALATARAIAAVLVCMFGAPVLAADVAAGRAKALMCQACHGLDGQSKVPDAPNLAGQVEGYLAAQLAAFKAGTRKSEAMNVVAASLSDADVADLAAYYAAIEITTGKVPGR